MEEGKVSIVVPVYNVEEYLERCIESVLQQVYENWELILVDDGSSDNSGMICDYYANKDKRIQVLHTVNRGVSSARNSGIELICGQFVIFVDSDDWLEREMLSKLVDAIVRNKSEIASCDVYYVTEDKDGKMKKVPRNKWGKENSERNIEGNEIYRAFFINSGTLWNKLFKTEIIRNIKFDITQRYGEDTEYLLRLMPKVKKVTIIPYCGYNYFINRAGNVVSAALDERSLEFIQLGKRIYKELANSDMGAIGVYRIFAVVKQTLDKIPNGEKNKGKYKKYYTEAKRALRFPSVKDKKEFLLDNRMEKKIRLEYCIKLVFPRHGDLT